MGKSTLIPCTKCKSTDLTTTKEYGGWRVVCNKCGHKPGPSVHPRSRAHLNWNAQEVA